MAAIPPPFDWSKRGEENWTSPSGTLNLKELVSTALPGFVPHDFQLRCSANILSGTDVVCLTATGDGKSALIYIPALVRQGAISIVISPTNFLEIDMSDGMKKKGLSAIAINSATLASAALASPKRDLWKEATSGEHQVIFIGPETFKTSYYTDFITNPGVCVRLGQFTVDEFHLLDEWGAEFRVAFQDIATMQARLPDHTVFVGLSATVEAGRQFDACIRALGLHNRSYHLEKRDCERKNVDLIIRPIRFASSTREFRDLDWLVPISLSRASDVPKRIIFVQSIEVGHRLTVYLRHLLPPALRQHAKTLIRHYHSLSCPDCKVEGFTSLYRVAEDRDCAIHIATDVLSVGMDIPDLPEVIIFGTISSLSSLVQRSGRPAREINAHGRAIIYVKKSDLATAQAFLDSPESQKNQLLLKEKDATSFVRPPRDDAPSKRTKKVADSPTVIKPSSMSLLLVFAAHILGFCITRQINIIYANSGTAVDCGRCSSCVQDINPDAREDIDVVDAQEVPAATDGAIPKWMRPKASDTKRISTHLRSAAQEILWTSPQARHDRLFNGVDVFLSSPYIKKITSQLVEITSIDTLKRALGDWRYWDGYGYALWEVVEKEGNLIRQMLTRRHQKQLNKQRSNRKQVKERRLVLKEAGLSQIKKVTLTLCSPQAATTVQENQPSSSTILAPVPSNQGTQQVPTKGLPKKRQRSDTTEGQKDSAHKEDKENATSGSQTTRRSTRKRRIT